MGYTFYIDESGDECIDKAWATRWFILGAIIVDKTVDLETSKVIPTIKNGLGRDPKRPLHWAHIRNHDKRLYICNQLLTAGWEFTSVIADKQHDTVRNAQGLPEKYHLYFYATRILFERLSWYAREHGGEKAHIVFEKRTNLDYNAMREYLDQLHQWRPPTEIDWQYLDWEHFEIIPKEKLRLLQATDQVCGALSDALEHSAFGNIEPRYILTLRDRFYRRRGNLFSYGLKFMHVQGDPLREYGGEYQWLKNL